MKTHTSPRIALLAFALLLGAIATSATAAPVVTRGPYLELAKPKSIIVRWRTSEPTDSRVLYGGGPEKMNHVADNATVLAALEAAVQDPDDLTAEEANLCCHALYLLAKWREPRAFGSVLGVLSLPDDGAFDLTGDIAAQDGPRILASVPRGDRPEIRALIESRDANGDGRGNALDAPAVLLARGEMERETLVAYLRELIAAKLERVPNFVWASVAGLVADLGLTELLDALRQPCTEEWVDPTIIAWEDIESELASGEGDALARFAEGPPPITDVAEETSWWGSDHHEAPELALTPRTVEPAVGRNEQCPCGNGKKYKKCCGALG